MVYAYAIRGTKRRNRLLWFLIEAIDDLAALKKARSEVGVDVDIYAGPLVERCRHVDCDEHAAALRNGWCALCATHLAGAFPAHFHLK